MIIQSYSFIYTIAGCRKNQDKIVPKNLHLYNSLKYETNVRIIPSFLIYIVVLSGLKFYGTIVLSMSMGFYALFTKIYSKNR